MNRTFRVLAWPAYAVASLLIAVPLANIAPGMVPFDVDIVQWRFRVAGMVASSIALPVLGVLLGVTAAHMLGHLRTARALAVFSFLAAATGVLAIGMFALDSVQLRPEVRVEALPGFDASVIAGIVKFGLGTIVSIILGVGAWKAGRRPPGGVARTHGAGRRDESDRGVLIDDSRS